MKPLNASMEAVLIDLLRGKSRSVPTRTGRALVRRGFATETNAQVTTRYPPIWCYELTFTGREEALRLQVAAEVALRAEREAEGEVAVPRWALRVTMEGGGGYNEARRLLARIVGGHRNENLRGVVLAQPTKKTMTPKMEQVLLDLLRARGAMRFVPTPTRRALVRRRLVTETNVEADPRFPPQQRCALTAGGWEEALRLRAAAEAALCAERDAQGDIMIPMWALRAVLMCGRHYSDARRVLVARIIEEGGNDSVDR